MKVYRVGFALVAVASLALALPAPAMARELIPDGVHTTIIGGERAPQTDWAVQLIFSRDDPTKKYGCTGEALNSEWILTARHCIQGVETMNVYYSNSTKSRGQAYPADRLEAAPSGDVALIHLSNGKSLSSYGQLGDAYTPSSGDKGMIMGYGMGANKSSVDGLRQAEVSVLGESRDGQDGPAVHLEGVNGAANHGDSGGPFMIDGRIVGVCSTGDSADPGDDINAGSNYANLAENLSWIKQTAGL